MNSSEQNSFERDLIALCKRYNVSILAGFYVSRQKDNFHSGVTVAAPWAKPNKRTYAYIERITWYLEGILRKEPPPESIEYY